MQREIKQNIVSTSIEVTPPRTELLAWMQTQIVSEKTVYLIAHFDDGVIWGRKDSTQPTGWLTSHDLFSNPNLFPDPREVSLQHARAFCEEGELLVWRDGKGQFHASLTTDVPAEEADGNTAYLDEPQILWGDSPEGDPKNNFQLWRDGSQGLLHALPLKSYWLPKQKNKPDNNNPVMLPPLLWLRHYLADDTNDLTARIERSRLVGFKILEGEEAYWINEESEEDATGEAEAEDIDLESGEFPENSNKTIDTPFREGETQS